MNPRDQDGQRRLDDALRGAFERAPELQPREGLTDELRQRLREESARDHARTRSTLSRRWLPLAAIVMLTAGLGAAFFLMRALTPADALARDAIGDHRNCALREREVRTPMKLEDAAQQFDRAYHQLETAPPDEIRMPDGSARVIDRHACAFGSRRFGHVVLNYRGHIVSLLMTEDAGTPAAIDAADAIPHLIGHAANGLSVVSVSRARHNVLLVGDLDTAELTQLSRAAALPLAQQLNGKLNPLARGLLAILALERPR